MDYINIDRVVKIHKVYYFIDGAWNLTDCVHCVEFEDETCSYVF